MTFDRLAMKSFLLTLALFLQVTIGFAQTVYSGKTEKVFHLSQCKLIKKDLVLYTVKEATDAGLTPCKICTPLQQKQEPAPEISAKKEIKVADSLYYPGKERILIFGEPDVRARTFEGVKQSESVVLVNKLDNDWVAINYKGKRYYCLLSSLMTSKEYANLNGMNGVNNTYVPPAAPSPSSSRSSYTPSRTIQTGPRGGQYYINKNGNKTYIKRK